MQHRIPWFLIYTRFFLTLPAIAFGYYHYVGLPYIVLMLAAAATDYYDGALARKWGVETAALRQWDSIADSIFFIGVFAGMWLAYPHIVVSYLPGIIAVCGIELIRYVLDLSKFGKGASYHALSAKVFGVSLLIATLAIMGFGVAAPFLPVALALGILSEIEGLIISVVLKDWRYNIRHVGIAIKIRRGIN